MIFVVCFPLVGFKRNIFITTGNIYILSRGLNQMEGGGGGGRSFFWGGTTDLFDVGKHPKCWCSFWCDLKHTTNLGVSLFGVGSLLPTKPEDAAAADGSSSAPWDPTRDAFPGEMGTQFARTALLGTRDLAG